MPELPDVTVYVEALRARVLGQNLTRLRLASPFLLRSVTPPPSEAEGRRVQDVSRLGKRLVLHLEGERFVVLHLMIAGRLQWRKSGDKIPSRVGLAAFDFSTGSLILTEAGPRKRASLYLFADRNALGEMDRGGMEPLEVSEEGFREALLRENHTLKRALTDPRLFSGIGNAYSDEILHRARLSPVQTTRRLSREEIRQLWEATRATLVEWTDRLRREVGDAWPDKVTAFRKEMAVHGRFRQPCPICGTQIQRISYADNETNYCPRCQTEGRILADRALSRLLGKDWPRSIEELEEIRRNLPNPHR